MSYRFNTQSLPQLGSWIGFERMFDELDRATERTAKVMGYPPYNLKKVDKDHYVIELAVAGFGKADINITTEEDQLVIKGEMKGDPSTEYIYKGIAERNFERNFTLADHVVVNNASMVNGFLRVFLERMIPDEKKPKSVPINDADSPDVKTVVDTKQLLTEE